MGKKLHIKCELEDCESCFNYPDDREKIEGIIAIEANWLENKQKADQLIAKPPQTGLTYTLTINGSLKLDLEKDFWVFYVDPLSQLNGIGTQKGIDSIRFCLCRCLKKESENRLSVRAATTSVR